MRVKKAPYRRSSADAVWPVIRRISNIVKPL